MDSHSGSSFVAKAREDTIEEDVELDPNAVEEEIVREHYFKRTLSADADSASNLHEILDISGVVSDGVNAIVDDSFNRCFTRNKSDPCAPAPPAAAPPPCLHLTHPTHAPSPRWNFNWYLFPMWIIGVLIRYLLLFPCRLLLLLVGFLLFFIVFFTVHLCMKV